MLVEAVMERAAGTGRADTPRAVGTRRMLVFSDRPLIVGGVLGLLPEPWRSGATRHCDADDFTAALSDFPELAVIDGGATGAEACVKLAVAAALPYLLLLDRRDSDVAAAALPGASAALLTQEVDRQMLSLAILAIGGGLRLFPDGLVPLVQPAREQRPPPDRLDIALGLVASGCRDAEIAATLDVSEGAARKLVQRAVARLGARTRCEAVARALHQGDLP